MAETVMSNKGENLRILQVMAGAPRGGAETAFVDMCLAMKEAGQNQEIITRANDIRVPMLRDAGLPVHTLPFGGALDFYTSWKIARIAKAFRPHIVQTWMSRASQKLPKRPKGLDYVSVARLGGYYKLKHFPHTDRFITITPKIRDFLIENGVPPDYVRHINNFAETEGAPVPVKRSDLKTPNDAFVLLSLGRLHDSKAFDLFIDAAAQLPDHVHLWIAGEGPDRAKLEAQIKDLGLETRVHLLGWRNDRAALLQAADICVFPSRYEPFGTVFVQAWAQKIPVITSDADGPKQFMRSGEDGIVFPVDDKAALIDAVKTMMDNPQLREKFIQNGSVRYEVEFTKEQCVSSYLEFYRQIIKEAAHG